MRHPRANLVQSRRGGTTVGVRAARLMGIGFTEHPRTLGCKGCDVHAELPRARRGTPR